MRSPTDFKTGINIQPNPEMTRADHMAAMEGQLLTLYTSLEGWPEFNLDKIPNVYNIQRKLLIYSEIYILLGELSGECERFAIWCDAKKKGMYEDFMLQNEKAAGTAKFKEIRAHHSAQKYRLNRDHFKGLAVLWRNRMETTREAINILKWMIKDAHEASKGN